MIYTVVVGYGLAAKHIHIPLIRRQPGMRLVGVVARSAQARELAESEQGVATFSTLQQVLDDPLVRLIVIATPHDTHTELVLQTLAAGKDCVVDKVMCLATVDADRMIEARDRFGRMLSVFHNRRWDWDFLTVKQVLEDQVIGRPWLIESSVCRWSVPRTWRGNRAAAGTILHDWGAHLIDQLLVLRLGQCRELRAWIQPAPWKEVDSGGHGVVEMRWDGCDRVRIEVSRICPWERPRWSLLGSAGGFQKWGIDPQESALRAGDLDAAQEPPEHRAVIRRVQGEQLMEQPVPTSKGSWDEYYQNIVAVLSDGSPLLVTAEQAREVVRILEAVTTSATTDRSLTGSWGSGLA